MLWTMPLLSQISTQDDKSAVLVHINVGMDAPGFDMQKRFGLNNLVGVHTEYLTKSNYFIGIQADYLYGNLVKENSISNVLNSDTMIFTQNLEPAAVHLKERAYYLGINVGKVIPIKNTEHRNGIRISLSGGYLQHKIKIQDDSQAVPQFQGEYIKGYDRLTSGFSLNQFIGYQHLAKNRRINFYVGLEFFEAFTQSRRSYDYNTKSRDTSSRFDFLYGIKAGWTLPIYINDLGEDVFY